MSERQDAIALITTIDDPLLFATIWAESEDKVKLVHYLAMTARAALTAYAVAEGIEFDDLLQDHARWVAGGA